MNAAQPERLSERGAGSGACNSLSLRELNRKNTAETSVSVLKKIWARVTNCTIGRSALRIRPTESFQVRLEWPTAAPTIAADTRLQVLLNGLSWTPL